MSERDYNQYLQTTPVAALVAVVLAVGCEAPPPARDAGPTSLSPCDGGEAWPCPPGWVRAAVGGCGPAALLCQAEGGAEPGACDAPGVRENAPFETDDGGVGWRFGVGPDGSVTGGWNARPPACPEGWSAQEDGACEPVMRACPEGATPIPGGRCTPTALADCPSEVFPARDAETVGARVLYVRADAPPWDADGTAEHPFTTLREGIARAGTDGHVFVAKGTYAEPLRLDGTARIRGVCAARVIVAPPEDLSVPVNGALRLRGVTVRGGVRVYGALDAQEVSFAATGMFALEVTGANARATLRGVRMSVPLQGASAALKVTGTSRFSIADFAIEGGEGVGMEFAGGGDPPATVEDGMVRGMSVSAVTRWLGHGIKIVGGAHVAATRLLLVENSEDAIQVGDVGSSLTLRYASLRDTRPHGPDGGGKGVHTNDGASATLEFVRMVGNSNTGASAFSGATLTVRDCVVRNTRPRGNGTAGRGLDAHHGGFLTVERTLVEGNHQVGVYSYNGSRVTLRDVAVRGTDAPPQETFGAGIGVVGAQLDARRVLVEDSTEAGVAVLNWTSPSRVVIEDLIVRRVRSSPSRGFAMGFITGGGSQTRASRVAVVDVGGVGVGAQEYGPIFRAPGSRIEGSDYYIQRVREDSVQYNMSDPAHPARIVASYGLVAGSRASVALDRVAIDAVGAGVAVLGPIALRGVVVARSERFGVLNRTEVDPSQAVWQSVTCAGLARARVEFDDTLVDPHLPIASFGR